ncbi:NADH-quinone oxidoreductase subunit L [Ohtaekwangia koreensis]|uniref:NADH-quinone oxidoreductase subunit L n=1 Tax=Ohtaekwangia koreensis TaxID=688867 RepID=A0A1T5IZE9_9BACT|nr:NADH-quinone oxidoreductase subunit L [Ohtaekwangia koreensis]SKC44481.1 NADH-quinone oxidoreductase subunit L [Ohtaekwangia koreensis]
MVSIDLLVSLVPLFPLLGFLFVALNTRRLTQGVTAFIACGSVLFSFIISIALFVTLLGMPEGDRSISVTLFNWIAAGDFSASISFLVDPLSSLFLLIITGVGFLIHVYSIGYMHHDEGFNRFFSYLNLFVFFMLLLVMGANYLLMFVGWEGVGLCSYLLIGFWFKNQDYNNAANKAFIMNRIGDLGMLLGVILIFVHFGSIQYTEVFSKATSIDTTTLTLITILLFVGAMGKSAQLPLYTWLPDAMAGPTPVSALIHAATMVTAGVYMVCRNNLLYALSPATLELIVIVGLATALFAATIAIAQNDIKKVLAYSTVSQLGLMFLALGLGAFTSGIFHMATHAFFKALLFLGAGSVIHALSGEQDIRNMGGLKKYLPVTYITFFTGVLAISGIPPFAGFFSKDEILASAFAHNKIVWAVAVIASLLTAFYMFRLFFLTFFGKERASKHAMEHIHESPKSITIPLIALAALSVVGGFMGVPEALGGSHWLSHYLHPVFASSHDLIQTHHLSHTTEYILMGTVVAFTIVMIVIAYTMYIGKEQVPAAEGQPIGGLQRTLANKYYVDEIYNAIIVKPLYWISGVLDAVIERLGIDKLVNAFGGSVVEGSKITRLLQNGGIGYYIFVMVIGIVIILAYAVIR